MFVMGQSDCIRENLVVLVVFGQKWLSSGKSGCICAKVVEFGKKLYLGKVVVVGQKWLYSGKVCWYYCWLYLGKVVVVGQKWLYSGKVVVFGQKWLYWGKGGCTREL